MVAPSVNALQDEDITVNTATQSQVSTPSCSPLRVCSVVFSAEKLASKKEPNETAESLKLLSRHCCMRHVNATGSEIRPFFILLLTLRTHFEEA